MRLRTFTALRHVIFVVIVASILCLPLLAFAATATYISTDTATHGNWKGNYGADGYNVINDTTTPNPSYPTYITSVTPTGNTPYTWASTTIGGQFLQKAGTGTVGRIAACWDSATNFTVDINPNDTNTHQVAFYLVEYTAEGRSETIGITDGDTGASLSTQPASSFSNGSYYVYNFSGHIKVTFTVQSGANCVLSGIFFGAGSGTAAPAAPTSLTATPGSSQVALTWTGSSGATSYNVYRGTSAGGESMSPISTGISGTSYTDTAVTPGTTYYYEVIGVNSGGGSGASNEASAAVPTATASFVKTDTSTQGNWKGVYGADGYNIFQDPSGNNPNYPAYATVSVSGQTAYTASASSIDVRALLKAASGSTDRIAGLYYSATSETFDINLTDGQAHQIAFYFLDWGSSARVQTVTVADAASSTTLDSRSASSFHNGVYYVWTVKGHVKVTLTYTGPNGYNATASGIFFGAGSGSAVPAAPTALAATATSTKVSLTWTGNAAATSYNLYRGTAAGGESTTPIATGITGTSYTDTGLTNGTTYYYEVVAVDATGGSGASNEASATPRSATATFVKTDTTTQGSWKGNYGADGFNVINDTSGNNPSYPSYATVTASGNTPYTWASSSIEARALQKAAGGSADRIDACWYSNTSFTIDFNLTGGSHHVALYLLDYGTSGRSETITLNDTASGTQLDTQTASSFTGGVYYVWNISGDVTATITMTNGGNGVVSGLFFGNGSGSTAPTVPANLGATAGNSQVALTWTASTGATSYNVYRGTTAGGESTTPISTGLTGTTYTDTGLMAGTKYYYEVMAVNSIGGSGASNEASGTPTLPVPTGLLASPDNTQIVLSWNASSGATSYNVYRGTTSNGEGSTAYATGVTGTTYTDTGTTSGQIYYYKVAAVNAVTASAESSEAGATAGPILIDCGSSTSFTDSQGRSWSADGLYSGGSVLSTTNSITNVASADQTLYQYQRTGATFNYSIPVPNGYYNVTLYFAEIDPGITGSNQRLVDVTANGIFELTDFDIYSAAGGKYLGISRSFLLDVTNSTINLLFEGAKGTAAIAGVQIAQPGYGGTAADAPEPGWAAGTVPTDDGSDGGDFGPGSSFQVSLPSLVAENSPGEDISAYNPIGPSVSYTRFYRSTLATASGHTGAPGLSPGWTDNYDLPVNSSNAAAWSALTLTYPNNAQESWTPVLSAGVPTGKFTVPLGAPYLVTGVASSTTGQWTSITVTFKDHSSISFTPASSASSNTLYLYTGMANLVGHTVTINRDTAANSYRITSIVNDVTPTPTTLLKFSYTGSQLKSIEDLESSTASENREVSYVFTSGQLTDVSQIYADGGTVPPDRWTYGYQSIQGVSFLQTVTSPDPANVGGTTTASVTYTSQAKVGMATDAVGNLRSYSPVTGGTQVSVYNTDGTYASSWVQKYGTTHNVNAGFTDAFNNQAKLDYTDGNNPYSPTKYTNRNGQAYQPTYDNFGNLQTYTNPRGVEVTNTWDYSNFALGQLSTTQITSPMTEASTFSYYGATDGIKNGLLHIVNTPKPDTTYNNSPATVSTTYDYTATEDTTHAGGQVLTVVAPGNNASATLTTTFNYTNDPTYNASGGSGTYTQNEYVGEPLTVADAAGDTSHFRYDGRGNRTIFIDANGNLTSYSYNLADQLVTISYPATGDTGSGHAYTKYNYQYVGGPLQNTQLYDESGTLVREVDYTYTHEGLVASITGSTEPVSYQYDGAGRVTAVTDGDSNLTNYYYDAVGNLSAIHYPNYNLTTGYDIDQFISYDADQNLLVENDGANVQKTYSRSDPESLVTGIGYQTSGTVALTSPVNYYYDSYGRLSSVTDGSGTKSYTYDDLDEIQTTTKSFQNGPQNQTFSYSHWPDGSVETMTIPSSVSNPMTINGGNFSYSYDKAQRLTQVNVPFTDDGINGTAGDYISHEWQPNGMLSKTHGLQMKIPSWSVQGDSTLTGYGYNGRNFLTNLTNWEFYGFPPYTGLPVEIECSQFTGTTQVPNYDPPTPAGMKHDAAGNLTAMLEMTYPSTRYQPADNREVDYTYDTAHASAIQNRDVLVEEKGQQINFPGYPYGSSRYNEYYDNLFSLDAAYNGSTFSLTGSPTSFTPNADNQNPAYTFDGTGNPTTYANSATLTFDAENRLTAISSPSFAATYDADSLRASKTEGGTTTYFLYDGDKPVVEETISGTNATISAVDVWAADGLRARYYPALADFYSFDFDPQGNVVDKDFGQSHIGGNIPSGQGAGEPWTISSYEAYGKRGAEYDGGGNNPPAGGHQDPVGFGGQWGYYTDASGLIYMTHRYYDPGTGRFINRDPIGYQGGVNLYAYAGGNPVNEFDPSGLAHKRGLWQQFCDWAIGLVYKPITHTNYDATSADSWGHKEFQHQRGRGMEATVVRGGVESASYAEGPIGVAASAYLIAQQFQGMRDLQRIADEVQAAAPAGARRYQTVAAVQLSDGTIIVAGSTKYLSKKQQAIIAKYGAIYAKGEGHAEVTAINYARDVLNFDVEGAHVAASRPICGKCYTFLKDIGAVFASALKK